MMTIHRRTNIRVRVHSRRGAMRVAVAREATGLDHRLAPLAAEVATGRRVECAWAALRIHFPTFDDLEAASELGEWARRHGRRSRFRERSVRVGGIQHHVIYVPFRRRLKKPGATPCERPGNRRLKGGRKAAGFCVLRFTACLEIRRRTCV